MRSRAAKTPALSGGGYLRAAGVEQVRLRQALSCYNTGSLSRGAGYAARAWQAAAHVVPAIQIAGPYQAPATPENTVAPEPPRPPPGMEDALHAGPPVSLREKDGVVFSEIAEAMHLVMSGRSPPGCSRGSCAGPGHVGARRHTSAARRGAAAHQSAGQQRGIGCKPASAG